MAQIDLEQLLQNLDPSKAHIREDLENLLKSQNGSSILQPYSYISSDYSYDTYEYLIQNGLNPKQLLHTALNICSNNCSVDIIEKQEKLIRLILEYKINPNQVVVTILRSSEQCYEPNNEKYNSASLTNEQKHILELAIAKGADINLAVTEMFGGSTRTDSNGQMVQHVVPQKIFEYLIKEHSLSPNIVLEYAISHSLKELADFAFQYNVDIERVTSDGEFTLLENAVVKGNIYIIDLLLDHGASKNLSLLAYAHSIGRADFSSAVQIVQRFPTIYDQNKIYEWARAQGASESRIKGFINFHGLITDYIAAINRHKDLLSATELEVLDSNFHTGNAENYNNAETINRYGYSFLHLALYAHKYELAEAMVKLGFDIYAKTYSGTTPLQILSGLSDPSDFINKSAFNKLIETISHVINDVDILLDSGETLADNLIQNERLAPKVIERTNDSLFYFLKQDADLFALSKDPDKTYIAISHGEGFWSSGVWSLSRLLKETHKSLVFYLVTDDMVKKGGEEFLKQFDAFINPGAGDSYPSYLEQFTKTDCSFSMSLEQHYQNILNQTEQLKIPYLGICAGAQHFSMYHGGSLKPLKGYSSGQHQVAFIKGSLAHFLSLTKGEQQQALSSCELPDVNVKGDTAHHFAAIADNLGVDMQLGAVSEHGVAMAYAHNNGIRYATQFHPEHHYSSSVNATHEKAWLDNFIFIADMHHQYRINNGTHPINYYQQVQERLDVCIKQPTCVTVTGDIHLNYTDIS